MAAKRASAKKSKMSERRIHFFRAHTPLAPDGKPKKLDIVPVLKHVGALPCTVDQRYWTQVDGNVLCAWVDDAAPYPQMRLATVRRSGLPLLEEAGILSPLPIGGGAGLYEPIHVCFFPNNIVGVELNFYGPRPARISAYLRAVAPRVTPNFQLEPLLRGDVLQQLQRLDRIRTLDLRVRSSYTQSVREADENLGAALEATLRFAEPQVVHIELKPEPYKRSWLSQGVLSAVQRLATRADLRENVSRFEVSGFDREMQKMEAVDILRDQLVAKKKIVRVDSRSRALDDGAAYGAIAAAYDELRTELELAASVG